MKLADIRFLLFIFLMAFVTCDLPTSRVPADRRLGVSDNVGDVLPLLCTRSAVLELTVDRRLPVANDPSDDWP